MWVSIRSRCCSGNASSVGLVLLSHKTCHQLGVGEPCDLVLPYPPGGDSTKAGQDQLLLDPQLSPRVWWKVGTATCWWNDRK